MGLPMWQSYAKASGLTATTLLLCALACPISAGTSFLTYSAFDRAQQELRFSPTVRYANAPVAVNPEDFEVDSIPDARSPAKAMVLSALVPGLGQYYNGSPIKAAFFLGTEVVAWSFYFNWHGDGERLTDDFEAYNRRYWSRNRYEQQYLNWTYGETDDENIGASEISHHLPDTETQQYFEMTGKYDQFAWGWEDARLPNGNTLDQYSAANPPPPITTGNSVPYSALRFTYENMRNEANNAFDKAKNMVYVSLTNRVVSSFEALFAAKKHNRQAMASVGDPKPYFKVRASLKSVYARRDTPWVKVTYHF